jgi:hypothetical protein
MTRLPVHVIHVPGADPQRDAIVARLQAEGGACVHLDPSRAGLMQNWLAALDCAVADVAEAPAPWVLILSDDADPLPGWRAELAQATHYSPSPVLGVTHFGSYGRRALARGFPYLLGRNLVWGGGVAYHSSLLPSLAEFAHAAVEATGYPHDDRLVGAFMITRGQPIALAARAIFDQPVEASLMGHHTPIRRPATTIANRTGPPWSTRPAALRLNYAVSPDQAPLLVAR